MKQDPRYTDLTNEIKELLYSIEDVLSRQTPLHGPLAHEFCFLQLRMICECIPYACVMAHAYIEELQAPKYHLTRAREYPARRYYSSSVGSPHAFQFQSLGGSPTCGHTAAGLPARLKISRSDPTPSTFVSHIGVALSRFARRRWAYEPDFPSSPQNCARTCSLLV